MPPEVLQTETGEWTELGRLYIPPWILLEALRVLCTTAGQWNDSSEAEKLALDIIIVAHHPSIGLLKKIPVTYSFLMFYVVYWYLIFLVDI